MGKKRGRDVMGVTEEEGMLCEVIAIRTDAIVTIIVEVIDANIIVITSITINVMILVGTFIFCGPIV